MFSINKVGVGWCVLRHTSNQGIIVVFRTYLDIQQSIRSCMTAAIVRVR